MLMGRRLVVVKLFLAVLLMENLFEAQIARPGCNERDTGVFGNDSNRGDERLSSISAAMIKLMAQRWEVSKDDFSLGL